MDGQEGGALVRIPKNNYKQVINQLQTISRKLTEFDTRIKELRNGYHDWVSKQSFVVELPVVTTVGVIHGAVCGAFTGALAEVAKHVYPQHSLAIEAFSPSPMTHAQIFAAMRGARVSIHCFMKRIRGKEDVQTRMVAGFGSGVTLKLMTSTGEPEEAVKAVITGVIGVLVGCTFFQKAQPDFSAPPARSRLKLINHDN